MNCKAAIITLLLIASTAHAAIKDLGVVGETYPVVEPDVMEEMRQEAIGRSAEHKRKMLEMMKHYKPADVQQLPPAGADKTFLVDMSYTLDQDLKDGEGRVIYPRGFTFNPLDFIALPIGLVILDGSDPDQLEWFKASPYFENNQMKLLITDGPARELIDQLQRPVFFLTSDIAKRMKLAAVPCVVTQKDKVMQVKEFLVSKEKTP